MADPDAIARWREALAARAAQKRRQRYKPAPARTRAGMTRLPPPGPANPREAP